MSGESAEYFLGTMADPVELPLNPTLPGRFAEFHAKDTFGKHYINEKKGELVVKILVRGFLRQDTDRSYHCVEKDVFFKALAKHLEGAHIALNFQNKTLFNIAKNRYASSVFGEVRKKLTGKHAHHFKDPRARTMLFDKLMTAVYLCVSVCACVCACVCTREENT